MAVFGSFSEDSYLVTVLFISTACWLLLIAIIVIALQNTSLINKCRCEEEKIELASLCLLMLNAIYVMFFVFTIFLNNEVPTFVYWGDGYSTRVLCSIQAGYFVADIIAIHSVFSGFARYREVIVHHILALWGYYVVTVHKVFAYHAYVRNVSEFSTPFFIFRNILRVFDIRSGKLYAVNGLLLFATFFLCRVAVIPLMYYKMYAASTWSNIARIAPVYLLHFSVVNVGLDLLNMYWFSMLLKGVVRHFLRN